MAALALAHPTLIPQDEAENSAGDITIFVAGDAILNRPWSQHTEPAFLKLVEEIRRADVAMVNLETLIHTFKGFTVVNTGGTPMASDPAIASELAWAGFDMLGAANNHTNDYGPIGIMETLAFCEGAGLKVAGAGMDLEQAAAPAYFDTPKGKVALIATTTSGQREAGASSSNRDVPGRPGLNPLRTRTTRRTVRRSTAEKLVALAHKHGLPDVSLGAELRFYGQGYVLRERNEHGTVNGLHPEDLDRNLNAVRAAREVADYVVVTIHAHGTRGLEEFARKCVDAGADLFFGHGPHVIRGIEIYKDKPIFYSLGDFAFQSETVKLLPASYMMRRGFKEDATPADVMRRTRGSANRSRQNWESVVAQVTFRDGAVRDIRLIPVNCGLVPGDLGQADKFQVLPFSVRGRPFWSDPTHGRYMIEDAAKRSEPYGTQIEYLEDKNIGVVHMPEPEVKR